MSRYNKIWELPCSTGQSVLVRYHEKGNEVQKLGTVTGLEAGKEGHYMYLSREKIDLTDIVWIMSAPLPISMYLED